MTINLLPPTPTSIERIDIVTLAQSRGMALLEILENAIGDADLEPEFLAPIDAALDGLRRQLAEIRAAALPGRPAA